MALSEEQKQLAKLTLQRIKKGTKDLNRNGPNHPFIDDWVLARNLEELKIQIKHANRFLPKVKKWITMKIDGIKKNYLENQIEPEQTEGELRGRRFISWDFFNNMNQNNTTHYMEKIRANIQTAFYVRYSYTYFLRNIETIEIMDYTKRIPGSPQCNSFEMGENFINEEEERRLEIDNIVRPNTKWRFYGFKSVTIKVIKLPQALLGAGQLPDWLRNLAHSRVMVSLDTFNDNLCVWRCILAHQGERIDRMATKVKALAKNYWEWHTCHLNTILNGDDITTNITIPIDINQPIPLHLFGSVENFLNIDKSPLNRIGIRIYEPELIGNQVNWLLRRNPVTVYKDIITIGMFNNHAFYIKNISKLAKDYKCSNCNGIFTQACHLQRHFTTCVKGETKIVCKNKQVEAPQTAYEKAFYPKSQASYKACEWIEKEATMRGIHIHHALCGHGGEREVAGALVDGYHHETKTVFQFNGCYWHGCSKCFPHNRDEKPILPNGKFGRSLNQKFKETIERRTAILEEKYTLVEMWECEVNISHCRFFQKQIVLYPDAIVYDFEAWHDLGQNRNPTTSLSLTSTHVPISVSIGNTGEPTPTHLCNADPTELVSQFVDELLRRREKIVNSVLGEYLPDDLVMLPERQQELISTWCNQVPVVGFNSGKYDLNLIKIYFVERLGHTAKEIKVAKKGSGVMFLMTPEFRFLDIINYLGPGTSYDSWTRAYGCNEQKSWFPYEWLDSVEKLSYPGLPDYECWTSKLKKTSSNPEGYLLTEEEFESCTQLFKEMGMSTFADWLKYYNDLDITPFLEALNKMRGYYIEKEIDILKDAVSLPGVSLMYLLRGSIKKGASLFAPGEESYKLLKKAVVGGPSIVFTRYHEADVTKIRNHIYKEDARLCKKVVGFDANALYLSTMLQNMPCGQEKVVLYEDPVGCVQEFIERLNAGTWFGFADVKIAIPQHLHSKFEEFPPFFYNKIIPDNAVPPKMKTYLEKTGRKPIHCKKLVAALSGDHILLYAPYLKWVLDHGAVIEKVYTTIDYQPGVIFKWFVDQVTAARRTGDVEKSKALLAEVFKLLGNAAYGKMIEALERQTDVIYTTDEKTVDRKLRSAYFNDLNEIGDAYEIDCNKPKINITRPFQCGIAVYQLAKLRMLEFKYDFLDKYFDQRDYELIQMDTDSFYMAISADTLEAIVRPELRRQYEINKPKWLAWDKYSGRTPGLFKMEFEGDRMMALCSKCYYTENTKTNKSKFSTKGMSHRYNTIDWARFKNALDSSIDVEHASENIDWAQNIGFRMVKNKMLTYEQCKLGLSGYYDKRYVLEDGIHTEPIEYHE